ncbi:MAG: kynureninase [Anaerolineales bacterium]|nr:MAG: kynureninase [Anaerolineales bacterium]
MKFSTTDIQLAHDLDAQDDLAAFRDAFVIADPNLIYLDGNSLGRLPKRTVDVLRVAIEQQWGERLIRGWNDGWINSPTELGARIARLVGAGADEILVCEATSINLFKLAIAALRVRPGRPKIVSDELNFPSDLYILQGIIDLLGNNHRLELIPSKDGIAIAPGSVEAVIDRETALVCLTHVAFKSAYMYDITKVTELAHQAGALALWDLSHSVGAVPLDLNRSGVDLAVGCTYKYLNGGPGAPAFLYVRRELQAQLAQPMWGWFSSQDPFAFELDFAPAAGLSRFRVGTPPMLSQLAIGPAVDLLLEAGMDRLRAKSLQLSEYLIYLFDQWLAPMDFRLGSPRAPEQRGSHVSLKHPEAFRIARALIESPPPAVQVIPDFRAPDNIRLGLTPLYTTFTEVYRALERLMIIVDKRLFEKYSDARSDVT